MPVEEVVAARTADANAEQVEKYAEYIGLPLNRFPALRWIAQEGLMCPIPAGWELVQESGVHYFLNTLSGARRFDHPMDEHYRALAARHVAAATDANAAAKQRDLQAAQQQMAYQQEQIQKVARWQQEQRQQQEREREQQEQEREQQRQQQQPPQPAQREPVQEVHSRHVSPVPLVAAVAQSPVPSAPTAPPAAPATEVQISPTAEAPHRDAPIVRASAATFDSSPAGWRSYLAVFGVAVALQYWLTTTLYEQLTLWL